MTNGRTNDWGIVLPQPIAAEAKRIAIQVAERLRDIEVLKKAVTYTASQQSKDINDVWSKISISSGSAGLAILFAYMDECRPGEGWETAGRQHLELAARSLEGSDGLPLGLFGGLAGVGFAAHCLSKGGARYVRLSSAIDELLEKELLEYCQEVMAYEGGLSPLCFDVISGLSGIAAYLVSRLNVGAEVSALEATVKTLCWVVTHDDVGPRWRTPPSLLLSKQIADRYPHGNLDVGLAHGLPGTLAALSLCHIATNGSFQTEVAIESAADWIYSHRLMRSDQRVCWPSAIPMPAALPVPLDTRELVRSLSPTRTAWCYGNPGVARAIWLAGTALNSHKLRRVSVEAMKVVINSSIESRRIDSPTFCHGIAGLLQVVLRFAVETQDVVFRRAAADLTRQLLAHFEEDSLIGFRDILPSGDKADNPALLEGAAGVALVLMAASNEVAPTWDRLFMLS